MTSAPGSRAALVPLVLVSVVVLLVTWGLAQGVWV